MNKEYVVRSRKGYVNTGFKMPFVNKRPFAILFASDKPSEGYVGFKVKMEAGSKAPNGKPMDSVTFVQPVSSLIMAEGESLFTSNGDHLSMDANPPLLITTSSKGIRFEKK